MNEKVFVDMKFKDCKTSPLGNCQICQIAESAYPFGHFQDYVFRFRVFVFANFSQIFTHQI